MRFACVVLVSLLLACAGPSAPGTSRIVAIGDVHGAYAALLRILVAAELTDASGRWTGGKATLVQVGDLIDRGPDDRRVLELVMALESEAKRAGGRVVSLLGNHEVMNLHGDLRYVSAESWAGFAGPDSTGRVERLEAFGAQGRIGRWLRERPALVELAGVVFVHGGVHPELASRGLRQMNDQVAAELAAFDAARDLLARRGRISPFASLGEVLEAGASELESGDALAPLPRRQLELLVGYPGWLVAHPNGPLWFRGFAEWTDEEAAQRVPALLETLRAEHFVVGHTPQLEGGIRSRVDGRLWLIDCGILDGEFYPGGREQALEIRDGRFRVIDAAQELARARAAG